MAVANLDPITAAKMAKERQLRADLNSIDPVRRWRAKQELMQEGLTEAGAALVRQAEENEKQYQRIINQPVTSRYKPMTSKNILHEKE